MSETLAGNDKTTPRGGENGEKSIRATGSLSPEVRRMLLECPSRRDLFDRVLQIASERFGATVARVDFSAGESVDHLMKHDPRMVSTLATRFNDEYLAPFAATMLEAEVREPQLKRYDRGNQTMTLVTAPIIDLASEATAGAVSVLLSGGGVKPEVVLPQLDSLAALVSTVLLLKSRPGKEATMPEPQVSPPESASMGQAGHSPLEDQSALAKASQFGSTKEFGYSLVNSLCEQTKSEQVYFGVHDSRRVHLEAISGFPDFNASSPGVQIAQQAMEECVDHGAATVAQHTPPEEIPELPIHRQWATESRDACVCSVPLMDGDEVSAVVSLRRPTDRPFTAEEVGRLHKLLSPYGRALRVVEKANRTVGTQLKLAVQDGTRRGLQKGSIGRNMLLLGLLVAAGWFLFGSMTYRPICRTRVTAADLRHFSAPFDGKLQRIEIAPGQQVREGDLLVEFDTANLRMEYNALRRQITSAQVELRQAIEVDDLNAAALAKARTGVLRTQLAAIENQISEARIVAPADGTVVIADLEQRVGQVFPQGEELLQFVPDGEWLLEIEIPDDIVSYVKPQQSGTFAAASQPTESQDFEIEHVDGAATTVSDRNVFVATAPLKSRPDWMRSGMEGTARVETVTRPVWWVAMHRGVDWVRMNVWL